MKGLLAAFFFCTGSVLAQSHPLDLSSAVGTYCIACHNPRLAEASVQLSPAAAKRPWTDRDTWERALRQLRARTMPPAGNPRPDSAAYEALVAQLASALDHSDPLMQVPAPKPVNDFEIATLLAKVLWSSSPDAQLLADAESGRLHDPAIVSRQIRRMLADSKITALVTGFFDRWLDLDQITSMPADGSAFPEFDSGLRQALRRETELFIESQLREDRPVIELWTADYTFVNDRLARLYGIPNVTGAEFRRVSLKGTERAGLLGEGSFLAGTSVLTRHEAVDGPSTSPAARAKWIRVHFLDVPMRNPLPNLPPLLKDVLLSSQLRTLPDPTCDSCHANFLPLGYALENFDPLGRWRAEAQQEPIDVSGILADGTEFEGPAGLRRVLLERRDAFFTGIVEKLLAYAIDGQPGFLRPTPAERMPTVRAVLRNAQSKDYTWSVLLAGIAQTFAK